jgi:hypothetical protein
MLRLSENILKVECRFGRWCPVAVKAKHHIETAMRNMSDLLSGFMNLVDCTRRLTSGKFKSRKVLVSEGE